MAKSKADREPVARYVDLELTPTQIADLKNRAVELTNQLVQARQAEKDLKKEKKIEVEELPIHKEHQRAKKLADSMDVELQQLTKAIAAGKRSELLDHHWRYRASDNVLELVCELTGAVTERRFATDDEAALFSQGGLFDDNSGGGVH
jgi:hypothetical protein